VPRENENFETFKRGKRGKVATGSAKQITEGAITKGEEPWDCKKGAAWDLGGGGGNFGDGLLMWEGNRGRVVAKIAN